MPHNYSLTHYYYQLEGVPMCVLRWCPPARLLCLMLRPVRWLPRRRLVLVLALLCKGVCACTHRVSSPDMSLYYQDIKNKN